MPLLALETVDRESTNKPKLSDASRTRRLYCGERRRTKSLCRLYQKLNVTGDAIMLMGFGPMFGRMQTGMDLAEYEQQDQSPAQKANAFAVAVAKSAHPVSAVPAFAPCCFCYVIS